jgi:hypothetical protein
VNGIANPSFETAGTGGPIDAASWTEGTNHTRSSDLFHSGGWAIKSAFTGTGTSTRSAGITISPNTSYVMSGWIYKAAPNSSIWFDDIGLEPANTVANPSFETAGASQGHAKFTFCDHRYIESFPVRLGSLATGT